MAHTKSGDGGSNSIKYSTAWPTLIAVVGCTVLDQNFVPVSLE